MRKLLGGVDDSHSSTWTMDRLLDRFQGSHVAKQSAATMFWQAFLNSSAYEATLMDANLSPALLGRVDAYVVPHGDRSDLILLDPEHKSGEPHVIQELHAAPEDIAEGWYSWLSRWKDSETQSLERMYHLGYYTEPPTDMLKSQPFSIVVAQAPRIEYTAGIAPTPAGIEREGRRSTGGVVATNASGDVGITAALHAMLPDTLSNTEYNIRAPLLLGAPAAVDGFPGTIGSVDTVSDSCFIFAPALKEDIPVEPLIGIGPAAHEPVSFDGLASLQTRTIVTGYSPEIPLTSSRLQLRVLTQAVTQRGDSGAALVNDQKKVLGFSIWRTGIEEPIEFAAWTWADQVFSAHGLE